MQEIIDLLNSMGLGEQGWSGNWQDIPNISGGQIGEALGQSYGFGDEYNEGLFQGITRQQLQGLLPGTYSPFMTAAQQPLISGLISETGGKKAKAAAGGFAGSGQWDRFEGQAKDVYGKGMSDTLSGISQQRGQQQASIMDLINQWRETAAGLAFPT